MFEKIFQPGYAENPTFEVFNILHLIPIAIILIALSLLFIFRNKLRIKKNRFIFGKILASIMLIQIISLYSWYIYSGIGIEDALPLYMCRVVSIVMTIDLLSNKKRFNFLCYFWGLLGSIIALLSPDTSGRVFPHIMYNQFFITHGCMLISVMLFVIVDGYKPSKKDFIKMTKFTLVFYIFVSFINMILGANYSYFSEPPMSNSFFSMLPHSLTYKFLFLVLLLISNVILYFPFYLNTKIKTNKDDCYVSNKLY